MLYKRRENSDLKLFEQFRDQRAIEFFNRRWDEITDSTVFPDDWDLPYVEGTTPLTWYPIVSPKLNAIPAGKVFRMVHSSKSRMLVVGTRLGPIVVYVAKGKINPPAVLHFACDALLLSGFVELSKYMDVAALRHILGMTSSNPRLSVRNVGEKIESIFKHFTDPERYQLYNLGFIY
jgi:hypothetical protein